MWKVKFMLVVLFFGKWRWMNYVINKFKVFLKMVFVYYIGVGIDVI